MILSPDKYHYICLGQDTVQYMLKFRDEELEERKLETDINFHLNSENPIKTLAVKRLKN